MVQAKLRPKLRPNETLDLPRKGETQTMFEILGRENSGNGLSLGSFGVTVVVNNYMHLEKFFGTK